MRAISKILLSISVIALPLLASTRARAQEMGYTPPGGAAVPVARTVTGDAFVGSGLGNRYGLGYGARVGYTTPQQIIVGVDATRYQGEAASSETLVGGEVGLRNFVASRLEVRPFALVGAAIQSPGNLVGARTTTRFALQPGVLAAWHFGRAFVSAEGRLQVAPTPAAASLLGGAGLTF